MGRQLRRVPLDFDWPLNIMWPGLSLLPCGNNCDRCRHFARLAKVACSDDGCPECNIDPPKGDGYQLWETVTEGSPISPVFATPENLARWLVANDTSITQSTTYEQWLKFIKGDGWAPSMMFSPKHGLESGVSAVTRDGGDP